MGQALFDDPSIDFQAQAEKLARRRKLAEQLVAQAMQGDGGQGYHGGRVYAVGNQLGNVVQNVVGQFMGNQVDQQQQDLARQQREYNEQVLQGIPAEGPERQQAQLRAMQNPSLREIIKQQMGIDENEAKRIEAGEQAAANRVEAEAKAEADRKARHDEGELNRQNRLDVRQQPSVIIHQGGAGKPDADLDRELKQARLDAIRNPKPKLTAAQSKAADDADVFLQHVDNAIDLLNANPDALGLKTVIPDVALQRIYPEGVATRAAIGGLSAAKVHELSGAAVSAAEFARLRPYLPASGDDTATVQKKLQGLRKEALRIRERHAQGRTDAAPQPQSGGLTPAEQQELDALRAKHGRK